MTERKMTSEKTIYENKLMSVLQREYDVNGKHRTYTMIKRSDSVIAIPLTEERKTLLLKQYRYPTEKDSLEFPMGGVDGGETTIEALKRELQEETRLLAENFVEVGKFFPVPGLTDQVAHVFVIKLTEKKLLTASPRDCEEDIESPMIVSADDVFRFVRNGKITDGFTISAALFLKLYLERE